MERGPRHIEDALAPQVEALGFALVRVRFFAGRRQVLQIMIERADGSDVTVDDCAAVSRAVSPILDVFDPVDGAYALEVSSPGIDRPLTRPTDFDRFAGFEAKVELAESRGGRRRFKGLLVGLVPDDIVRLDVDGETVDLPLDEIQSAKLVLTDALIAAHQAARSDVAPADEGVQ
ncbi:MAG: ribosome maturation factor RimP [Alphaproteobacteria bacterium]|nr:ribosome maturation factor RimP [Alphaproteobacteria bacterium]MCB9928890.1 ribosome maturation factor RimP [Alphaproteobacteria bacterium]